MAITFVAASTFVDNAGGGSITVTKPAGLAAGHTVIVHLALLTTTSILVSPPDNTWYRVPLEDNILAAQNPRSQIYYHVATGSEPTWNFIFSGGIQAYSVSCAYSGVGTIDVVGMATGTATPGVAPVVTPSNSGGTILCLVATNKATGASAVTLDGALTSRYNLTSANTDLTLAMGDAVAPGAGVGSTAYSNTLVTQSWFVPVLILNPVGTIPVTAANVGVVPIGVATVTGLNVTFIDATVPTGIQNGDILVAFLVINYTASGVQAPVTITAPAGWTVVNETVTQPTTGTFVSHGGLYTHPVTNVAGEPGTYRWTISSTEITMSVDMDVVRGCTGIDTFSKFTSSADVGTLTPSGITCVADNEPLVMWAGYSSNSGGPAVDCVSLQQETNSGNQNHSSFSAVGPMAGKVAPSYPITSSNGGTGLAYQVGFIPAITNLPKIVGSTVVNRYSAVMSVAITIPSNTAVGDLAVAHVIGPTGGTITPPAGWSAITNASADDGTTLGQAFSHIVLAGDPGSVTYNFSGATTGAASIIALRNVSTSVLLASNSTTQGLTPSLSGIGASSIVLMYEFCNANPSGAACSVGLPQSMFITPFVYNPNGRNGGNIVRGGALSVVLQTGPAGSVIGKQYRAATGSTTGPQITIAFLGVAPSPPAPPAPIGPGTPATQTLPFHGLIERITSIPPININPLKPADAHEVNLALKDLASKITVLSRQLVKFAANPQQHYKAVSQPIPTTTQTDTAQALASNDTFPPIQSSDTNTYFPSTGYTSTLGPASTVTNVNAPNNTPTTIVAASPNVPMQNINAQADLVMAVVSGTWAAGMFGGVMDIVYAGVASGAIYFAKRLNVDGAGRFSDTQIFSVPAGVTGDTSLQFGVTQGSGGPVVVTTCTLYVGNLQSR